MFVVRGNGSFGCKDTKNGCRPGPGCAQKEFFEGGEADTHFLGVTEPLKVLSNPKLVWDLDPLL
jgi:hypothetical protein